MRQALSVGWKECARGRAATLKRYAGAGVFSYSPHTKAFSKLTGCTGKHLRVQVCRRVFPALGRHVGSCRGLSSMPVKNSLLTHGISVMCCWGWGGELWLFGLERHRMCYPCFRDPCSGFGNCQHSCQVSTLIPFRSFGKIDMSEIASGPRSSLHPGLQRDTPAAGRMACWSR